MLVFLEGVLYRRKVNLTFLLNERRVSTNGKVLQEAAVRESVQLPLQLHVKGRNVVFHLFSCSMYPLPHRMQKECQACLHVYYDAVERLKVGHCKD